MTGVQGVKRARSPSPPVPAENKDVPIVGDEEDELPDEALDDLEFVKLYKEEQREAEEAGEDLAEEDGTATAYDTESDDAVRKYILEGWEGSVKTVFKPKEVMSSAS
jgi:hypothetical protein